MDTRLTMEEREAVAFVRYVAGQHLDTTEWARYAILWATRIQQDASAMVALTEFDLAERERWGYPVRRHVVASGAAVGGGLGGVL